MPPTCLLAEGTCLSFPYLPHLPRFFFNSRAFEALGCAVHVQKTTNTVPTWGINQECNAPVTQNCKLETCAFEWRKGISQSQVRRGKKLGSRGWNELFERGKNKNSQGRRPVSARLAPTRTAWQKEKNTYVGDWPKNKRHSLGAARGTRLRGSTPRCQARMQPQGAGLEWRGGARQRVCQVLYEHCTNLSDWFGLFLLTSAVYRVFEGIL